MVKFARAQVVQLLLLGTLLISASTGAVLATGASAGPLEGVTGAINQAGLEPVGEITETVTSPIHEVTESVTQPVREGTEAPLSPPVHEVIETVTAPVEETAETLRPPVKLVTETVASPPVKQVTEKVASPPVPPVKEAAAPVVHLSTDSTGSSSGNITKSTGAAVRETVRAATDAAEETVAAATHATDPPPSSGGGQGAANVDAVALPGRGDGVTAVPPRDGSIRAPLPKWMAYIWPAIALTRPDLANLLDRWEQTGLRLALWASAGSDDGFGVAGVHASHGDRSGQPDSSSLFSEIPPAISHALVPDVPASALAYLCLVGLVVIVVFAAVSREIAVGRRQGRGR
jgi:hypothetical protein